MSLFSWFIPLILLSTSNCFLQRIGRDSNMKQPDLFPFQNDRNPRATGKVLQRVSELYRKVITTKKTAGL